MEHILYGKNDYKILQHLLNDSPKRIIGDDGYQLVFDYSNHYISVAPRDFLPVSQNNYDEAISVRCTEESGRYKLRQNDRILFSSQPIEKIWILRTILYFSDHITLDVKEEVLPKVHKPETKIGGKLVEIFSELSGAHEELICHPLSEEAKHINQEFSNLVDVGFVAQIDGKMLSSFSPHNAFMLSGKILTIAELEKETKPYYQFIEVEVNGS